MSAVAVPYLARGRSATSRLVRAGLLTALSDALWAVVLTVFIYQNGDFGSIWRGVASVLIGKSALDGGTSIVVLGLVMHCCVAFTWSALFLLLVSRLSWLRTALDSPYGVFKVAAVYGPFIWIAMSLVVIPLFVHRFPVITYRWFIQLAGHFLFVGWPMVASIGSGSR